jgi:hypothetical protein
MDGSDELQGCTLQVSLLWKETHAAEEYQEYKILI